MPTWVAFVVVAVVVVICIAAALGLFHLGSPRG
jgi:hypothetical protein